MQVLDISCSANVIFCVTGVGTYISVPEIVNFLLHWMKVVDLLTFVTVSLLSLALLIVQNLFSPWYFISQRSVDIFKLLSFIFVFLALEYVTVKHLLYNFLLVLNFHWFWCMVLLFCWFPSVSVYENTLGRCCSPSRNVFQLAIYFQYQAICVFALTLQWGFLLLELRFIFFSLRCNFRRFWKTDSNTWISYTSYWILKTEEDRSTSMQDMDEKSESLIESKGKRWLFGYNMDNWCSWHCSKDRREINHRLKWTKY